MRRNVGTVCRPRIIRPVRAVVSGPDWMEVSYFAGKSVILFTMFYSWLNWLHYRELRKREDEEKKK
jgi:hypothetical protein